MAGQLIVGLPPEIEDILKSTPEGRDQYYIIKSRTDEMRPHIEQALEEIKSVPEGRDAIAGAATPEQSADGNVYIFVEPANETSGVLPAHETEGYAIMRINPCDGLIDLKTQDGDFKDNTLRGTIGHEMEHIARGHHKLNALERVLGSTETIEQQAIQTENAITQAFGEEARVDDNYDGSARMPEGGVDIYSCGPETFIDVDPERHGSVSQPDIGQEIQTAFGPDQGTMVTGDPALPRQLAEASGEAIQIDPAALPPLPEQPAMDIAAAPADPSFTATARI